jgi:pectin methylesterase-like acyl-CoA thioesterase
MHAIFTSPGYRSLFAAKKVWALSIVFLFAVTIAYTQQIAFPGAEGAGRFTSGGRGTASQPTTVFEVTNLNDDNNPGSLRYAVRASVSTYPYRTIVFRVAGTIHLTSKLNIPGNTTIAGQTAPGGGICLADYPVVISGDNVIVRYIRIRMGDKNQNKGMVDGSGGDDAFGNLGGKNLIIDHCSVSWSSDEALTVYRGDSVTIQWCMVSEPLNYSYHFETGDADFEHHGYGGIWGGQHASFHHNLIAHFKGRGPRFSGNSTYPAGVVEQVDFRNNVIYNWGSYSTNGGEGGNYNVVNNYYKYGLSTSTGSSDGIPIRNMIMNPSKSSTLPYPKVYMDGNYADASAVVTANNWKGVAMAGGTQADTALSKTNQPFVYEAVTTHTATEAYDLVLLKAGAALPERDTLDQRIINDVRNRTGAMIDVQGGFPHGTPYAQTVNAWPTLATGTAPADDDHDGMPNAWETANGLNPIVASDRYGIAPNGYTNLENYLNSVISNDTYPGQSQLPAFPGAEGFAKFASGGRGGKVVEVTTLSDDGPGSFRQAFNAFPGEPITIVFRVGGIIELTSALKVSRSNITIAGQTAPGDGICIKGHSFIINGGGLGGPKGNIIVRYLRSRPGAKISTGVYGFDMENCYNVIVDHCSFSWANEECAAMYDTKNVTVQWSIISEGLYDAGHAKGVRSYGGVWGGQYASYHHNLIAHQNSRTVRFNGARAHDTMAIVDYRNNVIYNWRSSNACYGGEMEIDNGVSQVNIVNNFYKPGPALSGTQKFVQASYTAANAKGIGQWYLSGNIMNGNTSLTSDNLLGLDLAALPSDADKAFAKSAAAFSITPALPVQSATDAYEDVLNKAGAVLPVRDAVDSRVVQETRNGTASGTGSIGNGIIDDPVGVGGWPVYSAGTTPADTDHDGMPDSWETAQGLNPADENDRNSVASNGYTNLENYLNSIVPNTSPTFGTTSSMGGFTQVLGSPSLAQSYKAGGSNLTGNVTVTAPAGYQLSADSSTWNNSSTPLVLTPVSGAINTKLFVRLNAATAGNYAGNIAHTGTGIPTVNVAVSGTAQTVTSPINADLVVAKDGSGNYTTLQAAIDAAPSNRTTPFVIYIKNGIYKEKVSISSSKPFIHLVGESVANTIVSWDDYSGKVVNGVTIGTSTSATITISAADCLASNITFENATGYTGDGPQALAINVSGDRCAFKNCRFIGGQDTVLANGNGKRQYFKNCYIDGNTDFIFGSSIAVFDSCVIFPRDRVDGSAGGYVTAANTPPGQAYGYVFRDCKITKNRGVTFYTLGRPWQNDAATADVAKSNTKVVFLNAQMASSIKPEGWSTWDAGTNTSLITYAEYKTKKLDGSLLNTSQRVAWSKQLSDAEAAGYTLPAIFSNWDPCTLSASLCNNQPVEIAVSNMRVQRSASNSSINWNLSWPLTDMKYELYRSTDSINFSKINEVSSVTDTVVAFGVTDALPVAGTTYYYYVKASRQGMTANNSYIVSVNTVTPLDGEYRSAGSGFWTNAASGNGSNANSIWEKYVASSSSWVLQGKGVAPNSVNVTIRSGHTVIIDALKNCNNLTIESGGVLKSNGGYATPGSQTLRVGAGVAAGVVINNNGVLGGDANPDDFITLEFTTSCASVLITGSGVTKITRLRPLYPNTNALAVTFDQDVSISYNSGGFTAYYNNAANTTSENVTYTINAGKTVKLTNPAGSFNATPNPTPNPGGKYTYNINGTLDLSVTTAVSQAVPFSGNAASVVAINVGNTGVLKLGAGFNTVNNAPGATNGKVVLNIANGGLVDAIKTTNLNLGNNYFITEGTGALKRAVGSNPVLFAVGVSDASYNPVTLTNSGAADNFSVGVKNSFDYAPLSPLQVVNRQWSIAEEVAGGSVVEAKLGWMADNQAAAFDVSKPVSLMRYTGSSWENTTAAITGSGTMADPFMATAAGLTSFSAVGITNSYPSIATNAILNAFSQISGTPSASQSFNISGMSLTANLVITAPAGYELSANGGSTWSSSISLAPNNGSVVLTTITVRLNASGMGTYAGNIKAASTGITDVLIPVTGTTAAGPAIVVTGTLTAFAQTVGAPSAVQTYTISATNLNSNVTITPPDNYQVSANGGTTWFGKASPLVLTQTAGSLNTTTISVRLNASAPGSYAGNITNTSTGAVAVNVPVTGATVPPPALAATGTLAAFKQSKGTPSAVQTYTVTGSNLTSNITVTPPAGFEVSANATTWSGNTAPLVLTPAAGTINATVSVRLNAATAGSYSGNIVQATTGAAAANIAVTGVTTNPPVVTIGNNSLKEFSQTLGSASAAQVISLSGADLTGNISLTVPTDYELSADGTVWVGKNSTLVLTQTTGTVATRNIQVRLNASGLGAHNGTIGVSTAGSAAITIPVVGTTRPGFTIFPNPVHSLLTIYHPNRYTIGKLYIYSARGVKTGVYYTRSANNSTTVDVSALAAGVYFVEYRVLNEKVLMKFVKQ